MQMSLVSCDSGRCSFIGSMNELVEGRQGAPIRERGESILHSEYFFFFGIAFDDIQMSPFLVGIDEMFMVEYLRMVSII